MDKHFKRVRYGNGYGFKLTNSHIRDLILNKLERYYHLKLFVPYGKTYEVVHGNGSSSLKNSQQSDIVKYPHLVSYKLDLSLSYLYLTEYNDVPFCYYIIQRPDAGVDIFSTVQRFSPELFKPDTLLEGYLIDGNGSGSRIFVVEDLVVHKGRTTNMILDDRIRTVNNILDYHHQPDPVLDNYRIVFKEYVSYKYLRSFLTDHWQELSYKQHVIGVVFSPLGNSVVHKVQTNIQFGDTEPEPASVAHSLERSLEPRTYRACFLVKPTSKPDVYNLYLRSAKGELVHHDIASVPDAKTSAMLKELFRSSDAGDKRIMLCRYDNRPHIKRWLPVMVSNRHDPDYTFTVQK